MSSPRHHQVYNHFKGHERSRPGFEGTRSQGKEKMKQKRASSIKEKVNEAEISIREEVLTLEHETVEGQSTVLNLTSFKSQHYASVAEASKVSEGVSESDQISNNERPKQDQNPMIAWTEQKRSRKINTTSLLLKRKKNSERYKHRETVLKQAPKTLRLRGGGEDGGGMNSEQDEPPTTDAEEASSSEGGSAEQKRKRSEEKEKKKHDRKNEEVENSYCENETDSPLLVDGGSIQGNAGKKTCHSGDNWQCVSSRPDSWGQWEQDRQKLRPPPLDSPRLPDLAYQNMTVDEAGNEDGIEHFDLAKDAYRRTDAQVRAVREAQRDQRKVAGGIYQCREEGKENLYLHVMKGEGKHLGIKLVYAEQHQKPRVQFETFANMEYEKYVQCNSQRVRVNLPEETETGFVWYGHGGNTYPLSSSVYKFCERVDNDIHFSASDCDRVTPAPGASQFMCSNKSCGIIFWHLSVVFFHRTKKNHFEEAGQEHFAAMMLRSEEHVLLWTDKDGNQTRWTRLEHSPRYEKVHVFPGSVERIRYVVAEALLPQCNFALPAYSPILRTWDEPQPLKRIFSTCKWSVIMVFPFAF